MKWCLEKVSVGPENVMDRRSRGGATGGVHREVNGLVLENGGWQRNLVGNLGHPG